MTKICIPIKTDSLEILEQKIKEYSTQADVLEIWLGEFFPENLEENYEQAEKIIEKIFSIKKENNNISLLFNIKDKKEQGIFSGNIKDKKEIIRILALKNADYIDIDYEFDNENEYAFFEELKRTKEIQNLSFQLILSAHFFEGTPSFPSLKNRVQLMQNRGANICKIAAMPKDNKNLLTIIRLTENLGRKKIRFITISMGKLGKISRVLTPLMGGEMMFAPVEKNESSASGQLDIQELKQCLEIFQ